jgi:hypothetical protein
MNTQEATKTLAAALLGLLWDHDVMIFAPRVMAELRRMGYTITEISDED